MVTTQRTCRLCSAALDTTILDLGMSPLSNSYRTPEEVDQPEVFLPLRVFLCEKCHLVQLVLSESPERIFSNYAYLSSYSDSWLRHASEFADTISHRLGLGNQSRVVEIASNDGYLLQYFARKGIPVVGIEPADNVAAIAREKGIPTLTTFFDRALAQSLVAQNSPADLIVANNVLAHVPDLRGFVDGVRTLLKRDGVFTCEVPDVVRLIDGNQFDSIYHEHLCYFSFSTLTRLLEGTDLRVFDVETLTTHGGSLRVYCCRSESKLHPVGPRVGALLEDEARWGVGSRATYSAFEAKVHETKRRILAFLINARDQGQHIVGYGAPAKATTLVIFCGIRTDLIEYTVDRNPSKQGCVLPGSHIPIYAPNAIDRSKPDYVFVFPWNLKEEIMQQMSHIRGWGGRFLVPIPEPKAY